MAHKKYSLDLVKMEAQKYNSKKTFEKGSRAFYAAAHRNGWLDEVCAHMESEITRWTKERVLLKASGCKNISSFIKENSGGYKHAIKFGYYQDLKNLFLDKPNDSRRYWTKERIIQYASECDSYDSFFKSGAYTAASKMKILDEIQSDILSKPPRIAPNKLWDLNKCIDLLKGVDSRVEFMRKFPGAWSFLQTNGMLREAYTAAEMGYLSGTSTLESDLMNWLTNVGVHFEHRAKLSKKLEIDILIPESKIGIEINGLYWHSEDHKDKDYHLNKTNQASELGIQLLHIFEDQLVERNAQVKNFILSKIKTANKIHARKCDVTVVPNKIAMEFFKENHIQGAPMGSRLNVGLLISGELMGAMSFGIHHRYSKSNEIILTRLAYKNDTAIIGGASRMLAAAKPHLRRMGINKIISWSDTAITNGNVYEKLGFTLEKILEPDYFYTKSGKRFSKQSLKKTTEEKLSEKTERELRLEQGYLRVYDCGKKRWVMNID